MGIYLVSESSAASRRVPVVLVSVDATATPIVGAVFTTGQAFWSKNGGTFTTVAGAFTSLGDGDYYYAASQSELDTVGYFILKVSVTGALAFRGLHEVKLLNLNQSTFTVSLAASAIGPTQIATSAFVDTNFTTSLVNRFADTFLRREMSAARAGNWGDAVGARSPLGGFSKLVNRVRLVNNNSLEIFTEDDTTSFYTQTATTSVSAVPLIEVNTD